jgi:hypothetical protein
MAAVPNIFVLMVLAIISRLLWRQNLSGAMGSYAPGDSPYAASEYLFMASLKMALGISVEDPSLFGILPEMAPRFSEMNKVRVICEQFGKYEGYVIASQFRDGRWIYKISISEDPSKSDTFDNWIPEECLEVAR